jgi:hypothetical protein
MKTKLILLSLVVILACGCHPNQIPTPGHSGDSVSNGGNAVLCLQNPPKYGLEAGFYALDYVMTPRLQTLSPVLSLPQSITRIRQLLSRNAPESLNSFNDFFSSVNLNPISESDESSFKPFINTENRKWQEYASLPVVDDAVLNRLPRDCHNPAWPNLDYMKQTVVRSHKGNKFAYDYERQIMLSFFANQPMQASFILIHEWLWDFYEGKDRASAKIRKANAFLHSLAAEHVPANEFKNRLFHADGIIGP